MKILHQIGGNWTESQTKIFKELEIQVDTGVNSIVVEENNLYYKIKPLVHKWGFSDIRYPEFTKKELKESLLSAKSNSHIHGYPMPDLNFEYLSLTYDLTNYCEICGIGKKQKDAFRLKNVPKEGKKRFFGINWVFDEYFVELDLYNEIFKPLNIKYREILQYKNEKPFDTHVQLILPETSEELDLKDYPTESCSKCGRVKYQPMPQGFYPRYKSIIAPLFKSKDYFGTGSEARKRVFLTKELRDKLISLKIERDSWYIPTK